MLDLLEQAAQRDAAASYAQRVLGAVRHIDAKPSVVRDLAATALARTDAYLTVGRLQAEMTKWGYATGGSSAAQYVQRVLRRVSGLFREDNHGRWGLSALRALPQAAST
jgi:hypothetical protein